jgi:DHA3 family macrolide efflux protein-like MFS transporter
MQSRSSSQNRQVAAYAHSTRWKAPFVVVWSGQASSLVGSELVRFALIWWLTERTASATTLAIAAAVSRVPAIALGPFIGALIDRWNRRWVLVVSDALIALCTALLAALYWLDIVRVWHVYAILFMRALGDTFQSPTMRATTPLMVPDAQLARVAGMNQVLNGIVAIASPPLGALLLAAWPIQRILWLDMVTAGLAIAPLLFVRVPQPEVAATQVDGRPLALREMAEGARYLWGRRGLSLLVATSALITFAVAPAAALIPLLVRKHFSLGATQYAWMGSAYGLGVVGGGLLLSVWGGFRRRMVTSLVGLVGAGLGLLVVGAASATAFWLALAGIALAGFMVPLNGGPRQAICQSLVPPEMQGRFFTLSDSVHQAMAPLGLGISGPLADAFGVRIWFLLAAFSCIAVALVRALIPSVLFIEERAETEAGAQLATH